MRRRRTIWLGCGWLVCIWAIAAAGIWTARTLTPTAEHVLALLRGRSLAGFAAEERSTFLDDVASALNRLNTEQRRLVQLSDEIHALYPQMTPGERLRFLERTRPPGSGQMARAFNRMTSDRRRRFVNEAVQYLEALRPDQRARMLRDGTRQHLEQLIQKGLVEGPGDAAPGDSLELQPFVEQTQRVLQGAN